MSVDYSNILKRSWEITWKNKWLWVPALVMAAFSGSGFNGGGGGSNTYDASPSSSPAPSFDPTNINDIKDKTSYVLGSATNYLTDWLASVSTSDWILIGFLSLVVILVGITINWVLMSWAKGALIMGLEDADNNKVVTLKSISPYGLLNIKKLIVFGLISFAMTLLFIICLAVISGISYLISTLLGTFGTVLLILLGIFGFLFLIFVILIFTMITIYAERLIVIKGMSPWEAWKKGLTLSKGNFFPTLLMGIINSVIGFTSGCLGVIALLIIFAVPGFLLIYPIFKDGFRIPSVLQIIAISLFVILFFSINLVIRAIFVVFDNGNWNLLFKEILKIKKEVKNE